jgi:hypothetical protein
MISTNMCKDQNILFIFLLKKFEMFIIVVNFSGNDSFLICYNAVITEEQTKFDTINIDIKTRTKRWIDNKTSCNEQNTTLT